MGTLEIKKVIQTQIDESLDINIAFYFSILPDVRSKEAVAYLGTGLLLPRFGFSSRDIQINLFLVIQNVAPRSTAMFSNVPRFKRTARHLS